MKIRTIVPLSVLLVLISCSFLRGEQKAIPVKGSVIATKYLIPVPSKLSFYVENELFQELQTNERGQFYFNVKKEFDETNGFVIVSPLKNAIIKDTLVTGTIISQVQAHDIKVDTFYFDSFKSISDLQLTKFQLMEINRVDSH